MKKALKDIVLSNPTSELIRANLEAWEHSQKEQKYPVQEKALNFLFEEACPRHDDLQQVIIKVSALNDFYSTNIFDTYSVAKHIHSIQGVAERLTKGDLTLVNDLARLTIKGKEKNFYSFASKYCSHHKPDLYPIYDYYVAEVVIYYRNKDQFANFKRNDLREYSKFVEIIRKYKVHYNLDKKYSLRDIDIFLWRIGRAVFPKRYKKIGPIWAVKKTE